MTTINDMAWDDRSDQLRQERETTYANNNYQTPGDAIDPDEDDLDEEDELLYEDEDELDNDTELEEVEVDNTDPLYDEDEDDDDDDLTANYTNTLSDDAAFDREYDANEGNGVDEDKDFEAHLAPESVDPDPNEIPEKEESEQEGSGYKPTREYNQPQEGNDTSYTEQTGVTPPKPQEIPPEGPAKSDFEAGK
ncbi:hypothetical protein IM792_14995 [Mucilaginibacter sp. JRF]|uniref:hypothetical protein n=1 Tax=Mucilaginibacter sp. JRF TaxID=2780088 RepID=UPI0018800AD9|nr:hypothetical protein [Mucilaginibacter sp. JRF]MBE9585761.1 hypothetical protein [Mucilaginibacter sp. JRF]